MLIKKMTAVALMFLFVNYYAEAMTVGPRSLKSQETKSTSVVNLSKVIAAEAVNQAQNYYTKKANGTATEVDSALAVAANRVLGSHFREIGAFAQMDAIVKANLGKVTGHAMDGETRDEARERFAGMGINPSDRLVNATVNAHTVTTPSDKENALALFEKEGSEAAFGEVVNVLENEDAAQHAASNKTVRLSRISYKHASYKMPHPEDNPCTHLALIAAGFGLVCALSEGLALPSCYAAAVAAVEAAACQEAMDHSGS